MKFNLIYRQQLITLKKVLFDTRFDTLIEIFKRP